MNIFTILGILIQLSIFLTVLSFGMLASWDDVMYLFRVPWGGRNGRAARKGKVRIERALVQSCSERIEKRDEGKSAGHDAISLELQTPFTL